MIYPQFIEQLFSNKDIDVNITDQCGCSPLHLVIECSRLKCVEALLTHKDINIHLKDEQCRTFYRLKNFFLLSSVMRNILITKKSKKESFHYSRFIQLQTALLLVVLLMKKRAHHMNLSFIKQLRIEMMIF